jgi:sporadic carbohydrate cluster 2OG-Fe(II) oxygenase
MRAGTSWDFRSSQELLVSNAYAEEGYVIEDADLKHLERMKVAIETAFKEFTSVRQKEYTTLLKAHQVIQHEESNDLRLFIMHKISESTAFQQDYYRAAEQIIHQLCGNELAMQKRPGLSVNLPNNHSDILPIHADTWNGVSPFELNIWIPFVDCSNSMCLYILKREKYNEKLQKCRGLLKLTSDELFNELREDLTWIPIEYGKILAFDQSLPHGYSLNTEDQTHWSMNCRFKGLHTPYWDKKLGEYFMPITVKNCTRLGMSYKHPEDWI